MIRNPVKFLDVVSFSIVVLFGFGVDGLWRRYVRPADARIAPLPAGLKNWWKTVTGFDRNWVWGCAIALGAAIFAWMHLRRQPGLLAGLSASQPVQWSLRRSGLPRSASAQLGWFILFFVLAAGLVLLFLSGRFGKPARARWGAIFPGVLPGRGSWPGQPALDHRLGLPDQIRNQPHRGFLPCQALGTARGRVPHPRAAAVPAR